MENIEVVIEIQILVGDYDRNSSGGDSGDSGGDSGNDRGYSKYNGNINKCMRKIGQNK